MFKRFTDGLIFGAGFAVAFIAIWYVAAYTLYPMIISSATQVANRELADFGSTIPSDSPSPQIKREPSKPFYELSAEELIKNSSVIALATYEKASDGKMKAIIKEFLKKEPDAKIYYNIGDEYPSSSYYPSADRFRGDGVVLFFTGSPTRMGLSTTYTGDRISGLSDIPVKLFRKKCKEPNA
jgi:hypothetical protein